MNDGSVQISIFVSCALVMLTIMVLTLGEICAGKAGYDEITFLVLFTIATLVSFCFLPLQLFIEIFDLNED